MENSFKIGEVYNFYYNPPHKNVIVDSYERVPAKLKLNTIGKLIKNLQENSDMIEHNFNYDTKEFKEYFRELEELNQLRNERRDKGSRKKSERELFLEDMVATHKRIFFPKTKASEQQSVFNAFIRNFDPEFIEQAEEDDQNAINAVYGGKRYTSTGKIVNKWYMLCQINIPEHFFNEKYMDRRV